MKQINVYLTFDGNCKEAMTFYAEALGADVQLMPFGDMPQCPQGASERIMHARIAQGAAVLMASDTMPGMPFTQGNNFSVSVDSESVEEVDRLFAALGAGGKPTMPPQDMFWGAYFGMLTDRFGVNWMFNFDKPKA
ncbi:VOC family protein [soil metagenome]